MVRNIPGYDDEQARVIAATLDVEGGLRLANCYFVNGQAPGTDKFAYKLQCGWPSLHDWLRAELAARTRAWCWWAISTWRPKTAIPMTPWA